MMECQSCGKQKNSVTIKKSALIPGVNLYMCNSCIENKYEPRWTIILAARQKNPSVVRDYIIKRRYVGKDISGSELIV